MRDGWIAHHASLLILEQKALEKRYRILSDEHLMMNIGEYALSAESPSPFLPVESLISREHAKWVSSRERAEKEQKKAGV